MIGFVTRLVNESELTRNYVHTHLNCCTFEWLVGIGNVFECYAVELSLVDISYSVVLPSLARRDRRFQKVFKSDIGMSGNNKLVR